MLATTVAYVNHIESTINAKLQTISSEITYMLAISFTPKHFLTSCTIILSLPPSPVSPESDTEMGASSSTTALSLFWFAFMTDIWARKERESRKEGATMPASEKSRRKRSLLLRPIYVTLALPFTCTCSIFPKKPKHIFSSTKILIQHCTLNTQQS